MVSLQALNLVGIMDRSLVQDALRTVLVNHADDVSLFDDAFNLFWLAQAVTSQPAEASAPGKPGMRRLAEAFGLAPQSGSLLKTERRGNSRNSFSAEEGLHKLDFEAMSAAEIEASQAVIRSLNVTLAPRPTRRWTKGGPGARLDLAGSMRNALKTGGDLVKLAYQDKVKQPVPLVILCDISGSMTKYAQVLLHFFHGLVNGRPGTKIFLFGTQLTHTTRHLRHRDKELAFSHLAREIPDWSGGTRIGEAINQFNRHWARRVLARPAIVWLITDGVDRGGGGELADNMARLRRSCQKLVWLNPLLRWEQFSPRSTGAKAMLPHVDELRPIHNLASLQALVASLSDSADYKRMIKTRWQTRS
jgi:uncharacterized protein with von Willebrand factor type A (vWA) domain